VCEKRGAGQGTVEWVALIGLVSIALAGTASAAGARVPGAALGRSIAERLICAVRLTEDCRNEPRLRAAHGGEVAALLRAHAPALVYEHGMTALPVDFRSCRSNGCAEGAESGAVSRSNDGLRTVAFTHVVDCRREHIAGTEAWGGNCSGSRAGNLYLQYWLYYPGSATAEGSTPLKGAIRRLSGALGHPSYHPDDWEGYQIRIGRDGTVARATSHHGYNGWVPESDAYFISGGSHAGRPRAPRALTRIPARLRSALTSMRTTKDGRLVLIPIETLRNRDEFSFAITAPWRKRVYYDPEDDGTD
jgi:hypothetical protein